MIARIVFVLLAIGFVTPISMPNIWIGSKQFRVQRGEKISIQIAHREKVRDIPFPLKKADLVKASVQSATGSIDLLPLFNSEAPSSFEFSLPKDGSYLVGIRSVPALIELSADSINDYAKNNDLEDVKYARTSKQLTDQGAKVMASWYAAMLLQAGAVAADDIFMNGSGYPLEIVPGKNPYGMKVGEKMQFTILWNGKPLFGARVIIRITADNNTGVQHIYSGKDGVIEAPLGSKGTWVVSVAKMVPSRNPDADWQSYHATYSFGY
jgi:hypothetical protein